jgi:hypothetical protein
MFSLPANTCLRRGGPTAMFQCASYGVTMVFSVLLLSTASIRFFFLLHLAEVQAYDLAYPHDSWLRAMRKSLTSVPVVRMARVTAPRYFASCAMVTLLSH